MATTTKKKRDVVRDKYLLYSAAVQSVDVDVDFLERVYRKERGKVFRDLREDFCGTAALACEWVKRRPANRAWGVDLDRKTLDWGARRYFPSLGEASERVRLLCQNVLDWDGPRVDVVAALNFSYSVFHDRELLGRYFRVVRRSLRDDGILFLDLFGGTEAVHEELERRRIPASRSFDGTRVPAFTYEWDQQRFNPIDHRIRCAIHFRLGDGTRIRGAFRYDWRLWTLPELRELLVEAGFSRADVYVEGWNDDEDESDGIYRRRTYFENQAGWVAYVVGVA